MFVIVLNGVNLGCIKAIKPLMIFEIGVVTVLAENLRSRWDKKTTDKH